MNPEPPLPAVDSHLSSTFGARLVTLSDGRPGLRGGIHVTASVPGSAGVPPAALDFISSDETLDRYGEIIAATGWNLENSRRNPLFQNSHQYGDIIFTLGKALITEVRTVADRQVLFQRIEFATEANPMARIAYALYSRGFLKTVSVGFIPVRWEDGTPSSSPAAPKSDEGGSSIPFRRRYLEQELLEVSAVAIPANPNALALALKSGAVEKADLKETADLINHALSHSSRTGSPPIHQSTNPLIHPLLPFARAIRDQLKKV
jgi:phage head maturation protease